jgi:hypothetical protein
MKFKLILSVLILLSIQAFSQTKNNISLVYGIANNTGDNHGAIGDYGYNAESGWMYGLSYTRNLSRAFSLETGLLYSVNKIQLTTIGPAGGIYNQNLNMLSVPVYAKLNFLKYFFAQWGFSLDHETNYSSNSIIDDQSGIGIVVGIGGKYNIGNASIFVNPFFCRHALAAQNNLVETGIKFGIGYNF